MRGVQILGLGTALPERVLTNEELARNLARRGQAILADHRRRREAWSDAVQRLEGEARELAREQLERSETVLRQHEERREQFETSDAWITKRTGIRERRVAAPEEHASDLAVRAARNAIEGAGIDPESVEFLVVGTVTPDNWTSPPTAARVQAKLELGVRDGAGLRPRMCFDVGAACTTFPSILAAGYGLVRAGVCGRGLVIGVDLMSRVVDWDDRNVSIVFGDGACALVLEACAPEEGHFLGPRGFFFGADGSAADRIVLPAGGSAEEIAEEASWNPFAKRHKVQMQGRAVFEDMVGMVAAEILPQAAARAGIALNDVDFLMLHQANRRMNEAIERKLRRRGYEGIVYHDIDRYANTTSASQGLALQDAHRQGVLRPGMLVLDCAFGGGYTWGSVLFRWPRLP